MDTISKLLPQSRM